MGGYALAKTIGVKFCECANRQDGRHFVSAVLPAVYSLNDRGTTVMPMLMDKFADAVITGKPDVTVWGTGKTRRELICSGDAADAFLFLMEHGESGQHYNVGSGEEHTIRELAEILQKISGFQGGFIFDFELSQEDMLKMDSLENGEHVEAFSYIRQAKKFGGIEKCCLFES